MRAIWEIDCQSPATTANILGSVEQPAVQDALDAAAKVTHSHKLLGSFPAAKKNESADAGIPVVPVGLKDGN